MLHCRDNALTIHTDQLSKLCKGHELLAYWQMEDVWSCKLETDRSELDYKEMYFCAQVEFTVIADSESALWNGGMQYICLGFWWMGCMLSRVWTGHCMAEHLLHTVWPACWQQILCCTCLSYIDTAVLLETLQSCGMEVLQMECLQWHRADKDCTVCQSWWKPGWSIGKFWPRVVSFAEQCFRKLMRPQTWPRSLGQWLWESLGLEDHIVVIGQRWHWLSIAQLIIADSSSYQFGVFRLCTVHNLFPRHNGLSAGVPGICGISKYHK